ncbi:MAG: copper-binding protein [Alphaproteobacteria bacterium]|nr:copper-binding protein [Alphaproteobacteria bacterium]
MKKITVAFASIAIAIGTAFAALAQEVPMVAGEVTKINTDTGKMTIKHEPIPNLDMGAMTMVFKAKDDEMLSAVKPGDKVKFAAERVNGQITVTKIEPTK